MCLSLFILACGTVFNLLLNTGLEHLFEFVLIVLAVFCNFFSKFIKCF
jgi:hypothetical protein